ncbi:MAG TPA: ABC transporter permease [Naasia sp.]|jgi:ABC-2 type transport system permease protein
MSATITSPRTGTTPTGQHLTGTGIVRSEWIKLRSLRSTLWSYAAVVVVSLGIALLIATAIGFDDAAPPASMSNMIVLQAATFGIYFGQLIVAVLGVLVISGEYSTGMIRSTLTAVPKRLPALAAKALVLFVSTFVVGLVSILGSLLVAVPILGAQGIEADFSDGALWRDPVLAALYLGLVALFALGLGTVLRNSAGGIAAALGTILLLPTILQIFAGLTQAQWAIDLMPYLFSNAGNAMYTPAGEGAALEQWQSGLVVLVWTAVSLTAGALVLRRRDA